MCRFVYGKLLKTPYRGNATFRMENQLGHVFAPLFSKAHILISTLKFLKFMQPSKVKAAVINRIFRPAIHFKPLMHFFKHPYNT
jgi:hypothetical protein